MRKLLLLLLLAVFAVPTADAGIFRRRARRPVQQFRFVQPRRRFVQPRFRTAPPFQRRAVPHGRFGFRR